MANMSYCRFENTAGDMRDCLDHINDNQKDMSEYEKRGHKNVLHLARAILDEYEGELPNEN